jgi:hypothetical protein
MSGTKIEYLRGLRVVREDPEWMTKILVGTVLVVSSMLIPILGPVALQGWVALIVRRAVEGQHAPLPRLEFDLDHLGKLLGIGFKPFIASFIWSLPGGFVIAGMAICLYLGSIAAFVGMSGGGDVPEETLVIVLVVVALALPVIVLMAMLLMMPAHMAALRAELTDDLSAGLQFGEVMAMTRSVFRELFVGMLALAGMQLVFTLISLPLCYLPLFPGMVVLNVTRGHLAAQLYQLYLERGGAPLSAAPVAVGVARTA